MKNAWFCVIYRDNPKGGLSVKRLTGLLLVLMLVFSLSSALAQRADCPVGGFSIDLPDGFSEKPQYYNSDLCFYWENINLRLTVLAYASFQGEVSETFEVLTGSETASGYVTINGMRMFYTRSEDPSGISSEGASALSSSDISSENSSLISSDVSSGNVSSKLSAGISCETGSVAGSEQTDSSGSETPSPPDEHEENTGVSTSMTHNAKIVSFFIFLLINGTLRLYCVR